ncbi:MAG: amidase [Aggregatilineales bacterium]
MNPILQMSATDIARKIRQRDLSPVEVVEAHIQRIEAVNPAINAVVTPMFDTARESAQAAQAHIEAEGTDNLPPLLGVPVTIKDCWAVKDVRFTGGSWYRRDTIAEKDAEAVTLLRDAGAIILGKTNLPDMCWSAETMNPVFGQTNNPHNHKYSAGGSSGGEGAIIAAGGSALGLGSDIAGSVRIPAAMNGCVALKPTGGRIPSEDHIPRPPDELLNWNTAGPMARRVEDLALALKVLSRTPVQDYQEISLQARPCTVYIHNGVAPVHKSVADTVTTAMTSLKSAGMATHRDDTLPLPELLYLYFGIFRKLGNPAFKQALGGGNAYSLWRESLRSLFGNGRISRRVLFFTTSVDFIGLYASLRYKLDTFEKLAKLRQQILDSMGEGGVILCPIIITPPPKHGWTWTIARQPAYSIMFNALEFPTVVLPIGYNAQGLPMAVQIVARPGEDEVALAVAAELECVYGGWQMAMGQADT